MERTGKNNLTLIIIVSILGFVTIAGSVIFNTFAPATISDTEIERISMDAKVLENGDLEVSETLYYDLDDKNGIIRNYEYSKDNNQSIEIESVKAGGVEAEKVATARNGDSKKYTISDNGQKQEVKIYYPANRPVRFTIKYRVYGLVKEYQDTQDLYWMMYDSLGESVPKKMDIQITFPKAIGKDNIKLFGHGDVDGQLEIVNDRTVKIDIAGFFNESFAETRIVLPTKPLTNISEKINENKLGTIIKEELDEAEKTNELIAQNRKRRETATIILYSAFILWLIIVILNIGTFINIYKKYDKEKYEVQLDYFRETPAYSPAAAALVMDSHDEIDQAQLIATIFNLYVKKQIILTNFDEEDVAIEIVKELKDTDLKDLAETEVVVQQWLETSFGETKKGTYKSFFNVDDKSLAAAKIFDRKFRTFQAKARTEYRKLRMESYNGRKAKLPRTPIILTLILVALAIVFACLAALGITTFISFVSFGILAGCQLIIWASLDSYKNSCYQLTQKGAEEKARCVGLYNYLTDYSLLNEAAPTAVNIWEKYFVYGLALGVTKKALNALYEKIPKTVTTTSEWTTIYTMHRLSYRYNIVQRSYQASEKMSGTVARSASVSRSSGGSSFGGGGGFSGGGGGGFGGGGSSSF